LRSGLTADRSARIYRAARRHLEHGRRWTAGLDRRPMAMRVALSFLHPCSFYIDVRDVYIDGRDGRAAWSAGRPQIRLFSSIARRASWSASCSPAPRLDRRSNAKAAN